LPVVTELSAGTSQCKAWEYAIDPGHVVQLVDTPGFNDTQRSDMDILASISDWLHLHKTPITGIIYLHRITDKRFTGASHMNLNVMQAICGEHFLPHVVLCTTMWNSLPDARVFSEAEAREHELINSPGLLQPLLAKHARCMRYEGTKTGTAILQALLDRPATHAMNLQLELRDPNCALEDTAAGRLITAEIRRKEEKLRQERAEEEEEERELREELELEKEAARREEQRYQEREARQTERSVMGRGRGFRRGADAGERRGGRGRRSSEADRMAVQAAQSSWRTVTLTGSLTFPFFRRER
jgi:hypothetical protein